MNAGEGDGRAGTRWSMELDCGHRIDVPMITGAVPAMAACVLEHELACDRRVGLPESEPTFGPPWPILRGVAYP